MFSQDYFGDEDRIETARSTQEKLSQLSEDYAAPMDDDDRELELGFSTPQEEEYDMEQFDGFEDNSSTVEECSSELSDMSDAYASEAEMGDSEMGDDGDCDL